MVGTALLSDRWQPGKDDLGFSREFGEVDLGGGRGDGDVDGKVVHFVVIAVLLHVGNVGVNDGDGHQFLSPLEHLHIQLGKICGDHGIDEVTRLDGTFAKV